MNCIFPLLAVLSIATAVAADPWVVDTQTEWQAQAAASSNLAFKDGFAKPTAARATYQSKIKTYDTKRNAQSIRFEQSPVWQNWEAVPNVGPANCQDAPVVLCLGPKNYWMFGRYGGFGAKPKRAKGAKGVKGAKGATDAKSPKAFDPKPAILEGFDVELLTTPDPKQFNAPGGLKGSQGGYHAWQSRDMDQWVHHGPVTPGFARWVTSAEHVDGTTYIYYDYPNDQDPHLYLDADLTDGVPGENKGMVAKDPSHGSDAGFIRDVDGRFHVIIEDWSPINASRRSWDSPLAGHGVSPDGIQPFTFLPPAVDKRTKPTGKMAEYKHPHWKQHPDWDTNIGQYEVHEPEQEAYGDWAVIGIGGQFYLFGDYDPAGGHQMAVGWFTSTSLDKPFTWCDKIGQGHPDPDIGFAEGQFYLITQFKQDFVSPGPWVEEVQARAGVDTTHDGRIDQWTQWQTVTERYDYTPGFAKIIDRSPAELDLSDLPAGFGFQFEFKIQDQTPNKSIPIIDKVSVQF